MSNLNNNHLGILLALTAVVIVAGTLFSLNKINMIENRMPFTGAATGTLSITVSSTTFITITAGTISLGLIAPGSWNSSENATLGGSTDPMSAWNNTNITSNFTVQNDGSVPIDLEIFERNQTSDTAGKGAFKGTTGCITANTCFMIRCLTMQNNGTSGTKCVDGKGTYTAVPVAAGTEFANLLNYTDTLDEAYFGVNLTVPTDEPAGNHTYKITFAATAS